jgi:hypothetical protein
MARRTHNIGRIVAGSILTGLLAAITSSRTGSKERG